MSQRRSNVTIMKKMLQLVKPLWKEVIVASIAGSVAFIAFNAMVILGGVLVADVVSTEIINRQILLFMGLCVLLRGIFRYMEQYTNHLIAFKVLAMIRHKVFRAVRRLAPAKVENANKGDLISMISGDIELLEVFYAHTISPIIIASMTSLVYLTAAAVIDLKSVVALFITYLILGVILPISFSKIAGTQALGMRQAIGRINNSFLDILRGMDDIIQYAYGKRAKEKMNTLTDQLGKNQKQLTNQLAYLMMILDILTILSTAIVCYVARDINQPLFIFAIGVFFSYQSITPVALLGNGLAQTMACGDRVLDLLEEEPAVKEVTTGKDFSGDSSLSMKEVNFSYEASSNVLTDFNLEVEPGKIIGLKGPSGTGKSTILKLFMRFWSHDSGEILVGKTPIEEINTRSLWESISYMTQETELFEGSLRDNLLIANPKASDDEILAACEKASIKDFILELNDGLDTHLKELGDNFSGGQRQRMGLARCFLKDAPILFFDEPTSNVDGLNEAIILKSILENAQGKTIIILSHRPSTLKICDDIVSLA